jgi:hypothetical protein
MAYSKTDKCQVNMAIQAHENKKFEWHVAGTRHVSSILVTLESIRHIGIFHLGSFCIIRQYSKRKKSQILKLQKGHASGVLHFWQFWRFGGYEDSKE